MLVANMIVDKRYRVVKPLGAGGMKQVYLVEDTKFDPPRRCALAELVDNFSSPQELQTAGNYFEREANLLSQLDHPNIVRVSDSFKDQTRRYLVMDYIDGDTLGDKVKNSAGKKLGEAEIIRIAIKVVEALEYLHEIKPNPVIYRDLKPSNVMITPDGRVKLIDFGIARFVPPKAMTGMTINGTIIGTPGYASPEQYLGRFDARSDLYSLGATMLSALGVDPTQLPPGTFPPLAQLVPGCGPALSALIDRALKFKPEERPQSASEFLRLLQLAAAPKPAPAPFCGICNRPLPAGSNSCPSCSKTKLIPPDPGKPEKPRSWLAQVAFSSVALVAVLVLAYFWFRQPTNEMSQPGPDTADTAATSEASPAESDSAATPEESAAEASATALPIDDPATLYQSGVAAQQAGNVNDAFNFYTKAANQGYAPAQLALGLMYDDGTASGGKSPTDAFSWYLKAADEGTPEAEANVAQMYWDGRGTTTDHDKAMTWYGKAIAQLSNSPGTNINPSAKKGLGWCFEVGQAGVIQNFSEAARWYRMAAEGGDPWGQYNLGNMYLNGELGQPNYSEAVPWLILAADNHVTNAQVNLGGIFAQGLAPGQLEATQVLPWLQEAYGNGNVNAAYWLGFLYAYGLHGVTRDCKLAAFFLGKAATGGNEEAKHYLDRLNVDCPQ
jgi:serine/threonine protein kinase